MTRRIFRRLLAGVAAFVLSTPGFAFATAQYPTPYFSQVIAGETSGGAAILPVKCNSDSDGVTCHFVVDIGTGTVSLTLPYNGTNGQTLKTATFLGVGARDNNGNFSPLNEDGAQNLDVNLQTALPAGTAIVGKFGIDQTTPGTTNGVQVNAALPSGGNTIGAVSQASGPWTSNVTQFGGNNVATGTGGSGVGIPRVTVSNDSTVGLVAGSAIIGKVGIDQTTPGTTNLVNALPCDSTSTTTCGRITGVGNQDENSGTFNALQVGSYNLGWNGTGWDRLQVDGSKNLKINCSSGCLASFPYGSGTAQTATSSSFVGVAGSDGTTVDAWKVTTSGVGDTQSCNSSASACAQVGTANDANAQGNGLYTVTQNYLYNGSTWDRMRTAQGTNAPTGVQAIGYNSVPDSPVICKSSAIATITSATTTLLVAVVPSKRVFLCGYTISSLVTTGATAQFVYGTQVTNPCDTGTANVTAPLVLSNDGIASTGFANGLVGTITSASNQLCVTTTGTITDVYVTISYAQF